MPAKLEVNQASLQLTILSIGNAKIPWRRAAFQAVSAAGEVLKRETAKSMSYSDHTLDDLAALDHPYARRHGSIQISHADRGGMIRDGRHGVHRQSGRLLRGLRGKAQKGITDGRGPQYTIWVDLAVAPHFRYITEGTSKMLPRDPLWETAIAPGTIREMQKAIVLELGKNLRSQAGLRFGPMP